MVTPSLYRNSWSSFIAAARVRGSKGGRAAALTTTPEQRMARARVAGNTTLGRYGLEYYSSLAKAPRKPRAIPNGH